MAIAEAGLHPERPKGTATWPEITALAVIGTATLAGVAFRWLNLEKWSLWWDEGFTLWASGLPLERIIPFARSDNQAPLYYLLQHFWRLAFGNSEFSLRGLSALFGTLTLVVFYFLAKRVLNDGMAIALSFWLFAFSLKQIWYSREARTYEAASFFALVALYALVRFLEKRSAWAFVAVVLSCVLTLYLHNMMFFYLLALDLFWLIYPSDRAWMRRIPEILLANVCMGLLYLPWGVSLLGQVTAVAGNLYWVPRPTLWTVAGTLGGTAGFDVAYLTSLAMKILPLPERILGSGVKLGLVVLCGALLAGGLWRTSKTESRKVLCFLVYCLLPIFLVFILSQKIPIYIDRIFTTSSIAVPIILALPLATQKSPKGKFLNVVLALALACVTALSSVAFFRSRERWAKSGEDWRGVVDTVLTIPETNRLVLLVPPAGEIFFDYYSRNFPALDKRVARKGLYEDFNSRFPPPKTRIINENDVDRLRILVESHKYFEIDLVLTHEVDPNGLIVKYLGSQFIQQRDVGPIGTIRIIPFRELPAP